MSKNAQKEAAAGTLESSDVLVTISPAAGTDVDLQVESIVIKQYGERIRSVAKEVVSKLGLSGAKLRVQDRGALECTLRARLETAIERATS